MKKNNSRRWSGRTPSAAEPSPLFCWGDLCLRLVRRTCWTVWWGPTCTALLGYTLFSFLLLLSCSQSLDRQITSINKQHMAIQKVLCHLSQLVLNYINTTVPLMAKNSDNLSHLSSKMNTFHNYREEKRRNSPVSNGRRAVASASIISSVIPTPF